MIDLIINKISNFEGIIKGKVTIFLNPYSYLKLRNRYELMKYVDKVHIDGISLVLILKILKLKVNRYSFDMTSIAPKVFEEAEKKSLSVYIIGTRPELISKSIKKIKTLYPNLNIIDYRHGYFENEKEKEIVIKNIKNLSPDIVICGMGTPLQEEFLISLKKEGWKGAGFTCGGFLHQTAKGINYYPKWANKYNLRWLYRILDEPYLWKRYFLLYPLSLIYILTDSIKYIVKKNSLIKSES